VVVDDEHPAAHGPGSLIRIDDDGSLQVLECTRMATTGSPLVVVDLRPRLLADAVARVLSADGADVVVLDEDDDPELVIDLRPAVAIGTQDRPTNVEASVVMRLSAAGEDGTDLATVRRVVRLLGRAAVEDGGDDVLHAGGLGGEALE
jgi:hypothetical protein